MVSFAYNLGKWNSVDFTFLILTTFPLSSTRHIFLYKRVDLFWGIVGSFTSGFCQGWLRLWEILTSVIKLNVRSPEYELRFTPKDLSAIGE